MAVRSVGTTTTSALATDESTTSVSSTTDLEELQEELEEAYQKKYEELLSKLKSGSSDSTTTAYSTMSAAAEDVTDALTKIQQTLSSGSTEEMTAAVSGFISTYNAMLTSMSDVGGVECNAMLAQFQAYITNHEEELEAIGITMAKDGALSVDTELLEAADTDAVAELFGQQSTLVKNISKLSDSVAQVASLKISGYNSLQLLYGESGTLNASNLTASILDAFS